ncbi:MAG: efflux RND transporter periplasmic adaptor subunit [Bacteroidia bacterium]|jgi:HlyD family secretion protein|nr:efflux RND transporter periplasmic adaptor subunit [Bacteroidia bacterium]
MLKKIRNYVILLLFVGGLFWTFYFLYQKSNTLPEVFETLLPFDTSIVKKTVATGSVTPRKEVNMKSRVSGIIDKLYIEAGQQIREGDVIARIKIIPDMLNMANAENRLNTAKINNDNAKLDYDRNKVLMDQSVISKSEMQVFELRLKTALEELQAAENQLQIVKDGVSKSGQTVSNTLVKSTISGMVLDVPVKEGGQVIESNTFNEGTTICSVANMGEMIFEGKLDESEVGKVKSGMDIVLTIGAIDTESFKAKLEYISPKGVSENGAMQFLIRASIGKENSSFLRAGYSANADIILDRRDTVLAIPESVLQFEKDKPFVEVETTTQVFEKRYIETGLSDGINIEVLKGLKKGEKIKSAQLLADKE